MSRNFTFCEECRNDVEYTITEIPMVGKIKGIEYHYTGKEARCIGCNTKIYVPGINDFNLKMLYKIYHKESKAEYNQHGRSKLFDFDKIIVEET